VENHQRPDRLTLQARALTRLSCKQSDNTAYGMFNLVTGLALLIASVIAGGLWDAAGPEGTFLAGVAFTILTLVGLLPLRNRLAGRKHS
jgi:predicted MFS family arabinose efflux permease